MNTTKALLGTWAFVALFLFTAFAVLADLPIAPAVATAEAYQRDGSPNNVRASITQVVGDSITWEVRWAPPPRGRLQAPVTGYEVEVVAESATGAGRIAGSVTLAADARIARVTVYHECADERDRYHARVRATGAFSEPAPWGTSEPVVLACDHTPPGPPEVEADTLAVDTVASAPDAIETTVQPLVSWATIDPEIVAPEGSTPDEIRIYESLRLGVTALGEAARVCAYTIRDGVRRKAGWAAVESPRAESDDGTEVLFAPLDGVQACWDVTILAAEG